MLLTLSVAVLLIPALVRCQSGDGRSGDVPQVICSSHISLSDANSLVCSLSSGIAVNEDDEDNEGDDIEKITVCLSDLFSDSEVCEEGSGGTMTSTHLRPVTATFNVTLQLKRGGKVNMKVNLRKIVKPEPPQTLRVILQPQTNQAAIQLHPYKHDYIRHEDLLFQFHIWTVDGKRNLIQNLTGSETLTISMEHLQKKTEYKVKVRAISNQLFQGTWSDWSDDFTFFIPTDSDDGQATLSVISIISIAVLVVGGFLLRAKKVCTHMWPSIPEPKHTLMQICLPVKDLPMSFIPAEVFSDLKIYPVDKIEQYSSQTEPTATDTDTIQSNKPYTAPSSVCSTSTTSMEDTDTSTPLSSSSAGGDECPEDGDPSTPWIHPPKASQHTSQLRYTVKDKRPHVFGVSLQVQEEDYVTMSNFYQIS